MNPYLFSLVRYRHDEISGEMLNVGVVLWSPVHGRLAWRFEKSPRRLRAVWRDFDGADYVRLVGDLEARLEKFQQGLKAPDLFATPAPEGEDLLTTVLPASGSCLAPSDLMSGLDDGEPTEWAAKEFQTFVWTESRGRRTRIDDDRVWRSVVPHLAVLLAEGRVERNVSIQGPDYDHEFRVGWRNGVQQVLDPVSFDFVNGREVIDLANQWTGRLVNLSGLFQVTIVAQPPEKAGLTDAYEQAKRILTRQKKLVREVVEAKHFDAFVPKIIEDTGSHSSPKGEGRDRPKPGEPT